jgi:copper chaperone NosL
MVPSPEKILIMKAIYMSILLFSLAGLTGCTVKPEPFAYGKDICHTCKMGIMDPRSGGELITGKGKIYKFDDVICMHLFLKSNAIPENEISQLLVINFEKENDFLPVETASFIISAAIKSPMGSHAAAFASKELAEKMNGTLNGVIVRWKDLTDKLE